MNTASDVPKSLNKGLRKKRVAQEESPLDIPDGDPLYGEQVFNRVCRGTYFQFSILKG